MTATPDPREKLTVARTDTPVGAMDPSDVVEPAEVSPVDTGLRERIADELALHHLVADEQDADGNSPCRCGDWREPSTMGTDEDGWDYHLATVVARLFEQAHGDLVVRAANLRAERDNARRLRTQCHKRHMTAEAELASRSTPALPAGMETVRLTRAELMAGILVGVGGEHDPVPTQQQLDRAVDLIFRGAKRRDRELAEAVLRELDQLSSPATDPEPATPDGPSAEWRAGWAAACRALDRFAAERMDAADDLDDMPVADAYGAVTVRAQHWMYNPERAPVAPQAPAEPTDEGGHRVGVKRSADDRLFWAANCKDCPDSYGGNAKEVADWAVEHTIATTPPAGPAVPEDTGTCPECSCVAPIHKTWCKTGDTATPAARLHDLLTMLGVNPNERPEHGGPTTAETLAAAVLGGGPSMPAHDPLRVEMADRLHEVWELATAATRDGRGLTGDQAARIEHLADIRHPLELGDLA